MSAHILIIEDNEMSLALAEYLLRQSGYITSSATDGDSGVRMALQNQAHLILCDLDLPVIDGPQVATTLRTNDEWRRVPILAFTAATLSEERRRALALFIGKSKGKNGSATWTRTKDHSINSRMLYQLSYRGILKAH